MKIRLVAFVVGVLLVGAVAVFGAPASRAQAGVPAIVVSASRAYAAQVRGVIGMQRHFGTQIHGGPVTHGETSDSGQLMQNGQFTRIAYYRIVRDGKAFSAAQIAQRNSQTNQDWSQGKVFFKEPYDPHYMSDYAFGALQNGCSACPAGTVGVPFTSSVKDAQHGGGVMYIARAGFHVVRLTYTPNVLPPHATSGTIVETGGQALPGLWYVVRIDETYRGHAFLFSGSGTFTGVFDHFRRFASVSAGEAALRSGTI